MSETTTTRMREDFEGVLLGLGIDPVQAREGDDWWRFTVDGLGFQGGVHTFDFRVLCTLCELDAAVALDRLYADMQARNEELGAPARLIEQDNYLHVRAMAPHAVMTAERMRAMIEACTTVARSDAAASLRSRYRAW